MSGERQAASGPGPAVDETERTEPRVVTTEPEPGVLLVELARPEARNALDAEMFLGLAAAWTQLSSVDRLRAAVIVGRGTAFCAGADLKASPQKIAESLGDDVVNRALLRGHVPDKPIVAAVNGHCIGGGLLLALGADLRLGSRRACFALPALRLGYHPRAAVPLLLAQCDDGRAAAMILGGRTVEGQEALAAGLLSELVPNVSLVARAVAIAAEMAAADLGTLGSLLAVLRAARASSDAVDALDARAAAESLRRQR